MSHSMPADVKAAVQLSSRTGLSFNRCLANVHAERAFQRAGQSGVQRFSRGGRPVQVSEVESRAAAALAGERGAGFDTALTAVLKLTRVGLRRYGRDNGTESEPLSKDDLTKALLMARQRKISLEEALAEVLGIDLSDSEEEDERPPKADDNRISDEDRAEVRKTLAAGDDEEDGGEEPPTRPAAKTDSPWVNTEPARKNRRGQVLRYCRGDASFLPVVPQAG